HAPSVRTDMRSDYGREVSFGVFPSPLAAPNAMKRLWEVIDAAERGGLDLVGIQDHPYQRRQLDTWSLMAAALARTEQIRVFPDVANLPLRPPAVMAKAAASLDLISEGRFELGLGPGVLGRRSRPWADHGVPLVRLPMPCWRRSR